MQLQGFIRKKMINIINFKCKTKETKNKILKAIKKRNLSINPNSIKAKQTKIWIWK